MPRDLRGLRKRLGKCHGTQRGLRKRFGKCRGTQRGLRKRQSKCRETCGSTRKRPKVLRGTCNSVVGISENVLAFAWLPQKFSAYTELTLRKRSSR